MNSGPLMLHWTRAKTKKPILADNGITIPRKSELYLARIDHNRFVSFDGHSIAVVMTEAMAEARVEPSHDDEGRVVYVPAFSNDSLNKALLEVLLDTVALVKP